MKETGGHQQETATLEHRGAVSVPRLGRPLGLSSHQGSAATLGREKSEGQPQPNRRTEHNAAETPPLPQTLAREIFGDSFALADMHCHLDFSSDMAALAQLAQVHNVAAWGYTPGGWPADAAAPSRLS